MDLKADGNRNAANTVQETEKKTTEAAIPAVRGNIETSNLCRGD